MPLILHLSRFTFCLISLLLSTMLVAEAQNKPPVAGPVITVGQISASELQTDPYPQDSSAEAVVLYDYADMRIQLRMSNVCMITRYHVRTKIRRKSAYDRATITIPLRKGYSSNNQFVDDLEGYTFNLVNNEVVTTKLDKSGVFFEKMTDNVTLQKFTLPNVREGCIIDYTYTLYTPFSVTYNPPTWSFQQHVPVLWSEFNARIPTYTQYKIITSGYLPLTVNTNEHVTSAALPGGSLDGAVQYRFAIKDAPAFRPEPYITTESDYISKIDFELASYSFPGEAARNLSVSWEAMDATLLKEPNFGGQLRRSSFLGDVAELIKKQHPDSLGRIQAACSYVSRTIKWDGSTGLMATNLKKVWEARRGDSGDINLMLINLLNELGFEANPVILSTRSHGKLDESFALLRKFNYVVAHITMNGKDMLLDATNVYLKPGMLPRQCLNGTGRLVHFRKGRFVLLTPTERNAEVTAAVLTLNDEGELSGTIKQSYGGYKALSERTDFLEDGQAKYIDAVRKKKVAWQIERTSFGNADAIDMPFNVSHELTIPEACQIAGDRFYLRPMLTEGQTDHLFKQPDRQYPVDFGAPVDETYTATFTLPKGMQVEEMPKPVAVALPNNGGRFTYQVAVTENVVNVTSRLSLRKAVYNVDEYSALREFFDKVLAKHAEQLVMKRVTIADKK